MLQSIGLALLFAARKVLSSLSGGDWFLGQLLSFVEGFLRLIGKAYILMLALINPTGTFSDSSEHVYAQGGDRCRVCCIPSGYLFHFPFITFERNRDCFFICVILL